MQVQTCEMSYINRKKRIVHMRSKWTKIVSTGCYFLDIGFGSRKMHENSSPVLLRTAYATDTLIHVVYGTFRHEPLASVPLPSMWMTELCWILISTNSYHQFSTMGHGIKYRIYRNILRQTVLPYTVIWFYSAMIRYTLTVYTWTLNESARNSILNAILLQPSF